MKRYNEMNILALDVRHSRIGYAFFSGPEWLLDWGASTVPSRCNDRATWVREKMAALLLHGSPVSIVMRRRRLAKLPENANGAPIFKAIRLLAEENDTPIYILGRDEIQCAFRIFQARTKEEIACALVGIFPELLARLPLKRKKWQPEPHVMIVFDAIATGFAYLRRTSPPE